jgi:hypothetical protein
MMVGMVWLYFSPVQRRGGAYFPALTENYLSLCLPVGGRGVRGEPAVFFILKSEVSTDTYTPMESKSIATEFFIDITRKINRNPPFCKLGHENYRLASVNTILYNSYKKVLQCVRRPNVTNQGQSHKCCLLHEK